MTTVWKRQCHGRPPLTSPSPTTFHLTPREPLDMPLFNNGVTIRGEFGTAFRRLVCIDLWLDCAACDLRYFQPFLPEFGSMPYARRQNIQAVCRIAVSLFFLLLTAPAYALADLVSTCVVNAPGDSCLYDINTIGKGSLSVDTRARKIIVGGR